MHINIIHLPVCNPGYVKGYLINLLIARGPDHYSFSLLPPKISLGLFY